MFQDNNVYFSMDKNLEVDCCKPYVNSEFICICNENYPTKNILEALLTGGLEVGYYFSLNPEMINWNICSHKKKVLILSESICLEMIKFASDNQIKYYTVIDEGNDNRLICAMFGPIDNSSSLHKHFPELR